LWRSFIRPARAVSERPIRISNSSTDLSSRRSAGAWHRGKFSGYGRRKLAYPRLGD
jgi:hypothetical protein